MAAIKTVARSATVAFAPTHPEVLATATLEGAIDASFSASASLDVFKIDFSRPDSDLDLLSSYSSSEKFNSLSWGTAGAGSEEYPYGLLASGLADGTISVWNPAPLIREDPNTEASLLSKSQKHAGRVRGLEFNVITSNLLASGGDDGDIYIWDLVNPTSPSHFPALRGGGQEHIVDLSWNRKVQQIMATTSNSGVSVVWDLRRQKSILSFTDPNNRRPCAALEWNPEGATQLIVASADDRSPSLQVWDLRNSISPVKELVGHTKGVVAMAWCPIDSALLLSSAKDYRTLCWDTVSGEIICELPISSNWNFDVQWSPRIAGVLSTSSYDGRVNLYNIEACSRMLPSEGHFGGSVGAGASSASMRAPKWLKRPAGVSFGFEGKLVSFGVKKGTSVSELNIQSLITEEDLISQSKEFEAAIEDSGSKSSLRALCERKAQESGSEEKKEVWSFLKVMFEEDARTSLLGHLGFALPAAEDNKVEGDANVEDVNADMTEKLNLHNTLETIGEDLGFLGAPESDVQGDPIDDGADFFNNLSTPKGVVSPQLVPNVEKAAVEESVVLHEEDNEDGLDEKDDCDKAVQHALVIADFKDAVKQCLSENRMADALVVAHVGGPELWEETLAVYLRKHRRPYRKVLAAVVAHDVGKLVISRPLNAWKETLALLCSYAGSEDWTMLCDALAAKLDAGGCTQAALLCYICAANIEELARIWYEDLLLNSSGATFFKELQDLMEKIVVLALAKGEKRVTPALARLIGSYAELLASQGVITAAMDYIGLVPPEESPEVLIMLRDRISSSKQEVKADTFANGPYASPVPATSATLRQAADLQAPPESIYPSYPSQQTSYETTQQGMFYRPAPALPDPTQGNSYPAYVPPPQETTYSQPGMFYPTAPPVPDWSQPPPSLHQAPFVPSSVKSFTPVDPPSTVNTMTNPNLFSNRGTAMAPSNQFPSTGNAMAPPNQFPSTGNAMTHPSQLSMGPGDWNSNAYGFTRPFQPAPTPSQSTPNMMFSGPANPSIVAAPTPRGFMPVSAPRAPLTQQQPGMLTPATQPQSPSSLIPPNAQPVPTMAAPPVTIQTVETANVPADLKPVVATLSRLFNETTEALGGARANPGKKREIDDNSRKLGGLFARLNTADISPNARAKLIQICQSLDAGDYSTAVQLQVSLTTSDWDECGSWLGPLKRMIKTRQALR